MTAEVADVLDRAADHIEKYGWWQGDYAKNPDDPKSPCCAVGAINHAAGADYSDIGDWVSLQNGATISLSQHVNWNDLTKWNDADGRTKADVVAALRDTAAVERAS